MSSSDLVKVFAKITGCDCVRRLMHAVVLRAATREGFQDEL